METAITTPDGNQIIIQEMGPESAKLYLKTPTKKIEIGVLDRRKRELRVFKNRNKHEHHKTGTYGFSHFLLTTSKHIQSIRIFEDDNGTNHEYLVSRMSILQGGNVMRFINETQIFYPIDLLERLHKIL